MAAPPTFGAYPQGMNSPQDWCAIAQQLQIEVEQYKDIVPKLESTILRDQWTVGRLEQSNGEMVKKIKNAGVRLWHAEARRDQLQVELEEAQKSLGEEVKFHVKAGRVKDCKIERLVRMLEIVGVAKGAVEKAMTEQEGDNKAFCKACQCKYEDEDLSHTALGHRRVVAWMQDVRNDQMMEVTPTLASEYRAGGIKRGYDQIS